MNPTYNKKIIIEIFAGIIIILIVALIIARKEKSPAAPASETPSSAPSQEFNYEKIIESLTPPLIPAPDTVRPSPKIIKSLTAPVGKNNISKQELEKILQSLTP